MDLTTRCPQCETAFPVSLEQLQLRKGYIRCVQCAHIFDGFEAVVPADEPAAAPVVQEPVVEPRIRQGLSEPVAEPHVPQGLSEPVVEPHIPQGRSEPVARPTVAAPDPLDHRGPFIIPPPPRGPIEQAGGRPFSIGPDRSAAGGRPEPQMPSVVRGRSAMQAGTGAFTISGRGAGRASGRSEPQIGGRIDLDQSEQLATDEAPSGFRIDERDDDAAAADFLFLEPRADHRPERRPAELFDGDRKLRPWMTPVWAVLILAGLLALFAQGIYVYRAQLANAFPTLRPALEAACAELGCSVPYERRLDAIVITGSALRSNSAPQDGVSTLVLEISLRNAHERPQEWPTLVLDLKDASGSVVVRRNLNPDIWVPEELHGQPFAARSEITVQVPVSVRGLEANGYQLDKFFP